LMIGCWCVVADWDWNAGILPCCGGEEGRVWQGV
jgi:hypothetical protein